MLSVGSDSLSQSVVANEPRVEQDFDVCLACHNDAVRPGDLQTGPHSFSNGSDDGEMLHEFDDDPADEAEHGGDDREIGGSGQEHHVPGSLCLSLESVAQVAEVCVSHVVVSKWFVGRLLNYATWLREVKKRKARRSGLFRLA
jgi:hypothetical protein